MYVSIYFMLSLTTVFKIITLTFVSYPKIWTCPFTLGYVFVCQKCTDLNNVDNVDPDQAAPLGAAWSGSTLFAETYSKYLG